MISTPIRDRPTERSIEAKKLGETRAVESRRTFGMALRTERLRRGLTRDQFGKMVDMTPAALEDLERGRGPVSVTELFQIGRFFETTAAPSFEAPAFEKDAPFHAPPPDTADFLAHLREYKKN